MSKYKGIGLDAVVMDADVFAMCIQHSFSTEKEEIMGLLIGEVDTNNQISYIKSTMTLLRVDKKPDRVEISPEQIGSASSYAETLAERTGSPWRVLGWYHSHPHITAWPSNLDVQTQANYQIMDEFFIGLIFSVFPSDKHSPSNIVNVVCFQAVKQGSSYDKKYLQLQIMPSGVKPYNLEGCLQLPRLLYEEEIKSYDEQAAGDTDSLTRFHNNIVKSIELEHIVSYIAKPLLIDLEERLIALRKRNAALEKLKRQLTEQSHY